MEFVNKVAESGIITLDLAPYIIEDEQLRFLDLKPFLFMEMILKEKDFRAALKEYDWQQYQGKLVAIGCSVEAIIPVWAYMLLATYLQPFAQGIHYGSLENAKAYFIDKGIREIDANEYLGKRIVLKGCGDKDIPAAAYVAASAHLLPVVQSLMYGEPCSTVPVYKKRNSA